MKLKISATWMPILGIKFMKFGARVWESKNDMKKV